MEHVSSVQRPHSDLSGFTTEDGQPVDNVFSEKQQRLLCESLQVSGDDLQPFVVMANVGLFSNVQQPPLVPDVLLSLEVEPRQDLGEKEGKSYWTWVYGKPPDLVVEVVSNLEGGEERKLADYARMGVGYCIIFDPQLRLSKRKLRAYRREGRGYVPLTDTRLLADLDLGLQLWRGTYEGVEAEWLRWCSVDGTLLATGRERADHERQRADLERQRADLSQRRVDELETRLRELGENL